VINVEDFNLRLSIESGQPLTFHGSYKRIGRSEFFTYTTSRGRISLENKIVGRGNSVLLKDFDGYTKEGANAEVRRRFGLDDKMEEIYSHINTDDFMGMAITRMRGMRITRNDPWETTLCFLISQFNNMKRIRLIIRNMIERFGAEVDGARLFPTPDAIADAKLDEIRACGTGFRDKYVRSVASDWIRSREVDHLYSIDYGEAKRVLMSFDGIGDKVADCILLFGYGRQEAFPIDLWVKRVMEKVYFNGRRKKIEQLHRFAEKRFSPYQGYAQQYIFYWGRESGMFK
jgi:N-glycosylase/DNA lyase